MKKARVPVIKPEMLYSAALTLRDLYESSQRPRIGARDTVVNCISNGRFKKAFANAGFFMRREYDSIAFYQFDGFKEDKNKFANLFRSLNCTFKEL